MATFTVASNEFYAKCEKLARVINSKNTLPVLDNLVFNIENGEMRISASDSENFATGSLTLNECSESFSFGLNARTLISALKEIPAQPLEVTIEETNCKIQYVNGHFNIPVVDISDYPLFPEMKNIQAVTLTGDAMRRILSKVPAFTAQDELRPIMGGICFNYENNKLEAVASDGHFLIRLTENCTDGGKGLFVMSVKTAKLAESFMDKEEESITVSHNASHSYVKLGTFELTSRLVEGKFPNYNAVIPNNYTQYIELERKELLSLVRRTTVFANAASQLLKFSIRGMELVITGEDYDFSTRAQVTMMVQKNGNDLTIGLKGTILQTLLNSFSADRLSMYYLDASRAVIFKPSEEDETHQQLTIQMPMMLND